MDKFYTKKEIADYCINKLNLNDYDFIIEPSAGAGSFLNSLPDPKIGLDILPENKLIKQMSWFDYIVPDFYKKVLVIGNPPFGKRNFLSKKFIKHAAKFNNVYTIAFILPNVFKKHTLQKCIPSHFRLKDILPLKEDSFEIDGNSYHVPCSFFIFEKSDGKCLRFDPSLYKETDDWYYSTKNDFDFFVMGASPTKTKDFPNAKNRGYWIKVKNPNKIIEVRNNFSLLSVKGNSSVNGGVFWLTKPELVKAYKEHFDSSLQQLF